MNQLFDSVQFGINVAAAMARRNLSIRKTAAATGVNYSALHRIMHATALPSVENYLRISRWLEQGKKKTRARMERAKV